MKPGDDALDGVLFRFWIRMAEQSPVMVAKAIMYCHTAPECRAALVKLAKDVRINLPGANNGP